MAGYHMRPIPRGIFGEASKVHEEAVEFLDAVEQGVKIMALVELADLMGAVTGWLDRHAPGTSLEDLLAMNAVTARAFADGTRVAKPAAAPDIQPLDANPLPIDWSLIARSVEHYGKQGFELIEVPWIVPSWVAASTWERASTHDPFRTEFGHLLGSAEQGFAALQATGQLSPGSRIAVSPCFRNEAALDATRRLWFVKAELHDTTGREPEDLARLAADWYSELAGGASIEMVGTPEGIDLYLDGLEIGSYGRRQALGVSWVYGTAIAEPRFSVARARLREAAPDTGFMTPSEEEEAA